MAMTLSLKDYSKNLMLDGILSQLKKAYLVYNDAGSDTVMSDTLNIGWSSSGAYDDAHLPREIIGMPKVFTISQIGEVNQIVFTKDDNTISARLEITPVNYTSTTGAFYTLSELSVVLD